MDYLCHIWAGNAQNSLSSIDRFLKTFIRSRGASRILHYSTIFDRCGFTRLSLLYVYSLFPCQILRSVPFFCQSISDNYSYITPCCHDRFESPTLPPYSLCKFRSECFSSRSATWWSRLPRWCFPEYVKLNFPLCLESSAM